MKSVLMAALLSVASVASVASAQSITLSQGTSTNIGGMTVYCGGGSQYDEGRVFVCDCMNTSYSTPRGPIPAYVRLNDVTEINSKKFEACGRAVWGENRHMWGFASPSNCRPMGRHDRRR